MRIDPSQRGDDKMKKVKAIKCSPYEQATKVIIGNDLDSLQEAVDGLIELVYPPMLCEIDERLVLMCNEEGKLEGLPYSRALYDTDGELYDIVAGTCYILYDDGEGGFEDIPDDVIKRVLNDKDWLCWGAPVSIGGEIHWLRSDNE